ncbi:aaa ATPase [Apiospora arundinis]
MQLKVGGLVRYDDIACHSRPESLVEQFPSVLTSALRKMKGRAYIVLDDLEHNMIDQVLGVISAVLEADDTLQKCSFIISARASPHTLERREAYPFVELGTENEGNVPSQPLSMRPLLTWASPECLQSLQVSGADLRKDKIVDPAPESNSWIWKHQSLEDLLNSKSGALAIIGKAGSGKSVLAKTILQGLHEHLAQPDGSPDSPIVGEWFYCRRQGEDFTSYVSLLKSIVSKFISKNRSLLRYCIEEYRWGSSKPLRPWREKELEGVLRSIIEDGIPLVIVIDAVDESDDEDDKMAKLIESLAENPSSKTKTIFLSRHRQEFESDFWKPRQIILHRENDQAIQQVVRHGLVELKRIMYGSKPKDVDRPLHRSHAGLRKAQPRKYPPRQTFKETAHNGASLNDVETTIIKRAGGVILWVVLVLENLCRFAKEKKIPPHVHQLLSIVDRIPQELIGFYKQMVEDLTKDMSTEELKVSRSILKWVNIANQHGKFTLGELWDALAIDEWSENPSYAIDDFRIPILSWNHFGNMLLQLCGSFLEIIPCKDERDDCFWEDSFIQLMHQTIKDFLSSEHAGKFFVTEDNALAGTLESCTRTLVKVYC